MRRPFTTVAVLWCALLCPADQKHGAEVQIGLPKILDYSRVYPLLDGLFLDVAATQIASLTLNPNAPNASALDALQQVFQLQLQYSATAGIQNGVAANQSMVASNYAVFQNQLLQQQSQLLAAQVAAQKQVGEAQNALDSLANATADQQAAAKRQLTVATDNLTSVSSQLTDVQSTLSKTLSVNPNFNPVAPSQPTSPPALQQVAPAIPTGPTGFSPNFPATKQMDNQITLLWERLARLVETLNQGNNPDERLYLVEFDTAIMPNDRKHQMLNVRYPLGGCNAGSPQPYVLDIYPRNAAVNVLNEKYRETRFGLGALISFFSVGLNAAYNRDHLQVSQALSQSSYITGYGVGGNSVGWVYGISLGDDSISPGVRSVYALIAVPKGCTGQILAPTVVWTKDPGMTDGKKAEPPKWNDVLVPWTAKDFPQPETAANRCPRDGCVAKIMYSRADYDSSATQAPVMVTVSLAPGSATLDKEEMINVNGRYLQRARDNFGRGVVVQGTSGISGILETGSLGVNTWLPVSSTTFVMNLDGLLFKTKFPNVLLQSPSGVIDLANSFITRKQDDPAAVIIDGVIWDCTTNCGSILPPLTRPKLAEARIGVARWAESSPPHDPDGKPWDQLCITVADAPANQTSASQATVGAPLQVITDADLNVWGSHPLVVLDYENQGRMNPVTENCRAFGARWVCPVPQDWRGEDIVVRIEDLDHPGGPFVGRGTLLKCVGDQCSNPFIWKNPTPAWNDPDGTPDAWTVRLSMANMRGGDTPELSNNGNTWVLPADTFDCTDFSRVCEVRFTIPKNQFDKLRGTTRLRVFDQNGVPRGTTSNLGLFASISPVITQVDAEQKNFKGSNLVFDTIQIGENGKPIPIICNAASDATQCSVGKYDPDVKGFLYFVTPSSRVEVIRSSDRTQLLHDPAAIKTAAVTPATGAAPPPPPAQPEKKPPVSVTQSQSN